MESLKVGWKDAAPGTPHAMPADFSSAGMRTALATETGVLGTVQWRATPRLDLSGAVCIPPVAVCFASSHLRSSPEIRTSPLASAVVSPTSEPPDVETLITAACGFTPKTVPEIFPADDWTASLSPTFPLPYAFVAVTVYVVSPAVAVGFPVILPLLVSSARPVGSSGVTENEVAGSPPAWLRTLGVITWS